MKKMFLAALAAIVLLIANVVSAEDVKSMNILNLDDLTTQVIHIGDQVVVTGKWHTQKAALFRDNGIFRPAWIMLLSVEEWDSLIAEYEFTYESHIYNSAEIAAVNENNVVHTPLYVEHWFLDLNGSFGSKRIIQHYKGEYVTAPAAINIFYDYANDTAQVIFIEPGDHLGVNTSWCDKLSTVQRALDYRNHGWATDVEITEDSASFYHATLEEQVEYREVYGCRVLTDEDSMRRLDIQLNRGLPDEETLGLMFERREND